MRDNGEQGNAVLVNIDTLVEENLSISDFAKPSIE